MIVTSTSPLVVEIDSRSVAVAVGVPVLGALVVSGTRRVGVLGFDQFLGADSDRVGERRRHLDALEGAETRQHSRTSWVSA